VSVIILSIVVCFVAVAKMAASELHNFDGQHVRLFCSNKLLASSCLPMQSNPHKQIALGLDYEYPLRQSIHLSMFYTLHCV